MLGLETLTDDQLLNVLRQLCQEYAYKKLARIAEAVVPTGAISQVVEASRAQFRESIRRDLGIDSLNSDQLIELRAELCLEIHNRGDIVAFAGKSIVTEETERLKAAEEALPQVLSGARRAYLAEIQRETEKEIREAVASGEISLVSSTEEAKQIAIASLEAKMKLIDEAVSDIKSGKANRFYFEIRQGTVLVTYGRNRVEARHKLDAAAIDKLAGQMRQVLTG
jgi:hypothetical protein